MCWQTRSQWERRTTHSSPSSVRSVSVALLCHFSSTSTTSAEPMALNFSVEMCGVSMVTFSPTLGSMNTACEAWSRRNGAGYRFPLYVCREEVSEYRVGDETQAVAPVQDGEKKSVKKVCILITYNKGVYPSPHTTPNAGSELFFPCPARSPGGQLVFKTSTLLQENTSNLVHHSQ